MSAFELREVLPESLGYHELLALRFRELREPLGMSWTDKELASDQEDRHFGLSNGTDWVGVLVVHDMGAGKYKLRQIAVTKRCQSQGIGRQLMTMVEECLQAGGVRTCELNSRLTVSGFYKAIGYRPVGEVFEEIGLPHVKMVKELSYE